MGNRQPSQVHPASRITQGIEELNDSIWEFQRPSVDPPEVEIIFFHGLQDSSYEEAYWKTWLSRDEKVIWPKHLLGARIPRARILSISYDARAKDYPGEMDFYNIIENLLSDILMSNAGQHCPVILVGHSLGGIVIKALILKCLGKIPIGPDGNTKQKTQNFLNNCKGVFYYSTPHNGSRMVDYFAQYHKNDANPLISWMQTLEAKTSRINSEFSIVRQHNIKFPTHAMVESLDTRYLGFHGKVVEEASARYDVDGFYTVQMANHYDVCRARDTSCNVFLHLKSFIVRTCHVTEVNPERQKIVTGIPHWT